MAGWRYDAIEVDDGIRRIASIDSVLPVALGSEPKPATLVFTDDPLWGYECAVQLRSGDFHSPTGCEVRWQVDDREAVAILASLPEGEPPRLSLDEPRHRWFELKDARLLRVAFPVADGRTYRVTFDVSDLDRSRMVWDTQRYAELYRQAHATQDPQ